MKYAHRILAALYLLAMCLWATSVIGEASTGKPLTWYGAWTFVGIIAASMWIGWQARGEHGK